MSNAQKTNEQVVPVVSIETAWSKLDEVLPLNSLEDLEASFATEPHLRSAVATLVRNALSAWALREEGLTESQAVFLVISMHRVAAYVHRSSVAGYDALQREFLGMTAAPIGCDGASDE